MYMQTNLYKHVIDDVVRNMRDEYLNESMDIELLEELKQVGVAMGCGLPCDSTPLQLWLSKLSLSGAVARPSKPDPLPRHTSKETAVSKTAATHKVGM